jgi:hypothetical protein
LNPNQEFKLVEVTPDNVDQTGFFCYMSKKKSEGYRRKLKWVKDRLSEGMQIKILQQGSRGFIEYIPAEYAWRAVRAKGYMVIHCLWIVGKKNKGQGHGSFLIRECLEDAKAHGMLGVAAVTSQGNWLMSDKVLLKNGFEVADRTPPFQLLVKKFQVDSPNPSFPHNWDERASRWGQGLTILRTDQCPYLEDAVEAAKRVADQKQIQSRVVEFETSQMVQEQSPTPYGVFHLILDGQLLSHHYLLEKDLYQLLDQLPLT